MAHAIVSCPDWMMPFHCFVTSNGVEGCDFNFSSMICKLRSNWIFATSSFASQNPLANLWICRSTGKFVAILSLGTRQHASPTIFSNSRYFATTSSHWRLNCSMLICYSLSICTVRPSLVQSSVVAPSCSWYKVCHGRATKFHPSPISQPTIALSFAFSVVNAPFRSVTILAI